MKWRLWWPSIQNMTIRIITIFFQFMIQKYMITCWNKFEVIWKRRKIYFMDFLIHKVSGSMKQGLSGRSFTRISSIIRRIRCLLILVYGQASSEQVTPRHTFYWWDWWCCGSSSTAYTSDTDTGESISLIGKVSFRHSEKAIFFSEIAWPFIFSESL